MKILIACEYSGTVRRAFKRVGHDVTSCDLLPSDDNSKDHYQGDVFDLLNNNKYDLMIAHPPCTHLAVSGAAWFKAKREAGVQQEALAFVQRLMDADIPKICVENPVSIISSQIRKPEQIIQPYQFGHLEQKKTCLWLKNLPKLVDTCNVYEAMMQLPRKERERMHFLPPSPERWKIRSKTYEGIAHAMSTQWQWNNL
jgi:hypothetical protein